MYALDPALARSHANQSTDLWQKAFEALDDELRGTLDFNTSSKINIVAETLVTAQEKRRLCQRKHWKVTINGKTIVLRDVVEKIIEWLDHFKAIGDVGSQYDPTHAALPWAGVRFVLKVRKQDLDKNEYI